MHTIIKDSENCSLPFGSSNDASIIASAVDAASSRSLSVQKYVYHTLAQRFNHTDMLTTLVKRTTKYLSEDSDGRSFDEIDFHQVFFLANQLGHQVTVAVLKTLLGAWVTNRRVQSCPRHCIFCAQNCSDALQHYAVCDKLWYAIHSVFPPFVAAFDPFVLFGLSPPSVYQIYGIYLAYHTYHACRHLDYVELDFLKCTIKSYTRGCHIFNHLVKAHLGKVQLKCSPSFPSSLLPSGASSSHRLRLSSPVPTAELRPNVSAIDREYRLTFAANRQAVLRARSLL